MLSSGSSSSKAADLLVSWEVEKTAGQPADTNIVSKESILTASVLNTGQLWNEKADDLSDVVFGGGAEPTVWGLCLLGEMIAHSSDHVLSKNCPRWCNFLSRTLQKTKDASILSSLFTTISSLLKRLQSSLQVAREFSSTSLPSLMNSLLWFTAAPPSYQVMALKVITQCIVYFHTSCSQYKAQLKKWALDGLFSNVTQLSQECSRLLVLLCLNNSHEWTAFTKKTSSALHFALSSAYKPVLGKQSTFDLSFFNLPPMPVEEPNHSATVLQQINVFSRILCYALLFPPLQYTGSSTGVPIQQILGVILFGLSVHQQQVSAHSTEVLLLHSMLPLIHTALWNILATLINSCQSHLLPYGSHIEYTIVQVMTADHWNFPLQLAVFKALVGWLKVRRDCELGFLSVVVKSLLSFIKTLPSNNQEVRLSGLQALSTLIQCCAFALPSTLSALISQNLPMDSCSLATNDEEEMIACLELLLSSVTANNTVLTPPLSKAIHVFSEQCSMSRSSKVKEFCRSALVQCSLLQHPNVVPILPLHHGDITANVLHNSTTVSNQQELLTNQGPLNRERTGSSAAVSVASSTELLACVSPSIASTTSVKRPLGSHLLEESSTKRMNLEEEGTMSDTISYAAVNSQHDISQSAVSFSDNLMTNVVQEHNITTDANGHSLPPMDDSQTVQEVTISDHGLQTSSEQLQTVTISANSEQIQSTPVELSSISTQQEQVNEFFQTSLTGDVSSEDDEDIKYFVDVPPDEDNVMNTMEY